MSTLPHSSLQKCFLRLVVAAMLALPLHAAAALLVYEPFDYPTATPPPLLAGTTATGFNLAGTYEGAAVHPNFQLRVSAPGLTYGNLRGAPSASGAKLTQLSGSTSNSASVSLAAPLSILPGQAIFFSALFTFDDSRNGNHLASIDLIDDASGGFLTFGEAVVGVRAIRASAATTGTSRRVTTAGNDRAFSNGQTLLLIGRYNNSPLALGDRLELLGYDTAASHPLPATFDPTDTNAVLYQELEEVDIDLARVSSLRFTIRGADNNFIDELRIGSTLADVTPIPEPHAWLLMLCGVAAVAGMARWHPGGPGHSSRRPFQPA